MIVKSEVQDFILLNFLKFSLKSGKKEGFENLFRQSLSILKKIKKTNPIRLICLSVEIVKPFCEIKNLKIGGSNYKVPTEIDPIRQKILALKFLVLNSIKRSEKSGSRKIAMEVFDTIELSSQSIKNCDDIHKTAETNKLYVQYRN